MVYSVINDIYPFSLLTHKEKELITSGTLFTYNKGDKIIDADTDKPPFSCYLLLEGMVQVKIHNEFIGQIVAPNYFGERAIFLDNKRQASIIASCKVTCHRISSAVLFRLVKQNVYFSYALAASLRHKHKLFNAYESFITNLLSKKMNKHFFLIDLIPDYIALHPSLHKFCNTRIIDFNLLHYVIPRFPNELTALNTLMLSADLPVEYQTVPLKTITSRHFKKAMYEIKSGFWLVLFRDEVTDFIAIITKLCAYSIEVKKIAKRLHDHDQAIPALMTLKDKQLSRVDSPDLWRHLPFNIEEQKQLVQLLGQRVFHRLYELSCQRDIEVHLHKSEVRYHPIASESWIKKIHHLLTRHFADLEEDFDVHIISSNTHSVTNCLSPWIHSQAKQHLKAEDYPEQLSPADALYAAVKQLLVTKPELLKEKSQMEAEHGIYHLPQGHLTGIDVNIIDVNKLKKPMDPALSLPQNAKPVLIFNIDYAYGKQSQEIIRNLILLFGKRIRSVSVFGKAGGLLGNRGDLVIPQSVIIQENDAGYSIDSSDVTSADFKHIPCHHGTMLTVLGTLMQSHEMLSFYYHFWHVVALEMEGGYFIQELNRAKLQKLVRPDLTSRFIYYISDIPLQSGATIAEKLSPIEGIPATYAITRVLLKKILSTYQ